MRKSLLAAAFSMLACSAQAQITNSGTTNGSVTITTGGTFQTVLNAVGSPPSARRSLTIENNNSVNTTDVCWIIFGAGITAANATKAKSIRLTNGMSYSRYYPFVPSDEIEATCDTTGDSLYVDTQ